MNVRDSEVIAGLLKKAGYHLVDEPEKADVAILNTCSVRQHAEDKVWSEIGRLAKIPAGRKHKRDTRYAVRDTRPIIGLVGCMAQNYKAGVFERSPEVDFVAGPSDIDKIPELVKKFAGAPGHRGTGPKLFERKYWETEGTVRPEQIYHTGYYADKQHAYVVISEGCSNYCSYCVVPFVRGELHNRYYGDIIAEIKEAVKKGIKRVTLLGQNVNAYTSNVKDVDVPRPGESVQSRSKSFQRKDVRVNAVNEYSAEHMVKFADVLKLVNEIRGLEEFSFVTSHPRDTSVELFQAMAGLDKLKKYLHLPVQSGADRILRLMNRGYTRNFYLELARNYRTIVKGGTLTTDIIVGFPGETKADFQETYDLVKKACFDAAYIFKYSPRPHSAALGWADNVPKEEKERRHRLILELQKKISLKKKVSAGE